MSSHRTEPKPLTLRKETLRGLTHLHLEAIQGGCTSSSGTLLSRNINCLPDPVLKNPFQK